MPTQFAKHYITSFDYHACLRINPWCWDPTLSMPKAMDYNSDIYISQLRIVAANRFMVGA